MRWGGRHFELIVHTDPLALCAPIPALSPLDVPPSLFPSAACSRAHEPAHAADVWTPPAALMLQVARAAVSALDAECRGHAHCDATSSKMATLKVSWCSHRIAAIH